MKKFLLLFMAIVVACTTAMAVPAKHGIRTVTQPDGSTLQVMLMGDEWHHNYVTADGYTIQQADDGMFYYRTTEGISRIKAHNVSERSADEKAFIDDNSSKMSPTSQSTESQLPRRAPGASNKATQVPNSGSPRVPIILVQYSDKSMSNTKAQLEAHYKTGNKSVYQYFVDQSKNAYTPQFDVYGIYTLPSTRATYGRNVNVGGQSVDRGVGLMVEDAISQAGNNIDWSQYDNDGDGEVDVCIVVYAGVGEAQSSVSNSVWPMQWDLTSAHSALGTGTGAVTRNGKVINKFAVFNEVGGSSDNGTTLDGIGTFCHEYSHCLGLPDFYSTGNTSYYGMGSWSLLDYGCYNNNGNTPCGYTAYERNFMGWMSLSTPVEGTTYTTATVDAGGQAYKITSNNANEYYIVENIQKAGWNQYAPSSGLMVTHVNYNATRWNNNTVNNYSDQGMTIIPADNTLSMDNESGDLYPYNGNNKLTSTSTPASTLYNSSTNLNKPITSITKNSNGTVSFTYMAANAVEESGGTASDTYLDIQKYATIDAAGWNTTYVNNMYKYTENTAEKYAWLTLSVYGAWSGYRYQSNAGPQKWIKSNIATTVSSGINGTTTWGATDIHQGSSSYFTSAQAKYFGNTSTSGTTARTVTFYVTNTTEVKLLGLNNNASMTSYPATLTVYECTKNADGSITETTTQAGQARSTTRNASINLQVTNLSDDHVYRVVVSGARTRFYEIGFKTPLNQPKLTVNPTDIYMSAGPEESTNATFNVKGANLEAPVSIALSDENGVFSVSPTSISIADAEASTGANVTVTFGSQDTGSFTGTITLTSGTLSKTVNLSGTCAVKGTAHSDYLDIQKYNTLDETDWYTGMTYPMDKPYEYTVDTNNDCAWLTLPSYTVYGGVAYDNQAWAGAYWSNFGLYGDSWNATNEFKGSGPYFGSHDEISLGSSGLTASGSTTLFYMIYNVTNCTKAKALLYNIDPTNDYPTFFEIYDITTTDDFTSDNFVEGWQSTKTSSSVVLESEQDLDPNRIYAIVVGGERCLIREMAFRTPVEGLPGEPIIVNVEPTMTTGKVTWTPGENNEAWNLRYRPYVELDPMNTDRLWDFEDSSLAGWTAIDADGDGYNWVLGSAVGGVYLAEGGSLAGTGHSPQDMVTSGSYSNLVGPLTPDNYLVSPKVKLGGSITFWAKGQDTNYPAEKFGVCVSTTGNANPANFTMVGTQKTATSSWVQYSFDLSAYAGQEGYVAIRHYGVTDQFLLDVDDIEILVPNPETEPEWIEFIDDDNVTSPYTITGLTPETTYEVQVQGVGGGYTSAWTPSTLFTTLGLEEVTLATLECECAPGETYTISDQLLVVRASGNKLWAKDANLSIVRRDKPEGQIDYMRELAASGTVNGVVIPKQENDWDQSNWVVIEFLNSAMTNDVVAGYVGKYITNVTGLYSDGVNYTIQVPASTDKNTVDSWIGEVADPAFTPNVYCAANFLSANLTAAGVTTPHGDVYFFMSPKVQEVFTVTYAVYAGNNKFTLPASESGMNSAGLHGAFMVDLSYNGSADLVVGEAYQFTAVAAKPATGGSGAPRKINGSGDDADGSFVVMPLDLSGSGNIVTKVGDVKVAGHEVLKVVYSNAAGQVSDRPFDGVNIVVTIYTDGTREVSKQLYR